MTYKPSRSRLSIQSVAIFCCLIVIACEAHTQVADQSENEMLVRSVEMLESADTDNNSILSRSELEAVLQHRFAKLDRNRDGTVNPDDAPRLARQRFLSNVTPLIERRDENDDGEMSYAEFSSRPIENFGKADENDDGEVELSALIETITAHASVTTD